MRITNTFVFFIDKEKNDKRLAYINQSIEISKRV